jgi:hypothetical protein
MPVVFNILHYYLYSVRHDTVELDEAQSLYHFMIQKGLKSTDGAISF